LNQLPNSLRFDRAGTRHAKLCTTVERSLSHFSPGSSFCGQATTEAPSGSLPLTKAALKPARSHKATLRLVVAGYIGKRQHVPLTLEQMNLLRVLKVAYDKRLSLIPGG
jgi:hypothetical protein